MSTHRPVLFLAATTAIIDIPLTTTTPFEQHGAVHCRVVLRNTSTAIGTIVWFVRRCSTTTTTTPCDDPCGDRYIGEHHLTWLHWSRSTIDGTSSPSWPYFDRNSTTHCVCLERIILPKHTTFCSLMLLSLLIVAVVVQNSTATTIYHGAMGLILDGFVFLANCARSVTRMTKLARDTNFQLCRSTS